MDRGTLAIALTTVGLFWGIAWAVYVYRQGKKRTEGQDWEERINVAVAPFKDLPRSISELDAKLRVLEKQMDVFWKGVSFSSAQALHSPHTKELDRLLEKFQKDLIEDENELRELERLLKDVTRNDPDNIRRKFAQDILTLIEVRYKIGGELIRSLENEDKRFASDIRNLSRRLEH